MGLSKALSSRFFSTFSLQASTGHQEEPPGHVCAGEAAKTEQGAFLRTLT